MFKWLKKLTNKENKTEDSVEVVDHKQDESGVLVGMYCPACGYMEVNVDSCALPMEGFAICPNCGDYLKKGNFVKTDKGYALATNLPKPAKRITGGHYRVRPAGPAIVRSKGGRIARFR